MKYQIAFGTRDNGFTSNINVVDEAYQSSLENYVDANIETLEKVFQKFNLVKRGPFNTTSRLKGVRIITTSIQQNNLMRQTFYFFTGSKGRQLVITCSVLAKGGEAFDSVFEESLKTFELIN
jgi:hypothetical protein